MCVCVCVLRVPSASSEKYHNFTLTHTVQYVSRLHSYLSSLNYGTLATLTGRYYAMDRDKRYERTRLAFEGLVKGQGERVGGGNLIQVSLSYTPTTHTNLMHESGGVATKQVHIKQFNDTQYDTFSKKNELPRHAQLVYIGVFD